MRIAFVAVKGFPQGGGVEKVTEEIGSRLVDRGHSVTVYSSTDHNTRDGLYKGMEIKTVASLQNRSLHKLSTCYHAIRHVLKRRDFDIVHFHAVGPSVFSLIPRLAGIPTVVQAHGIEWKRDKWGVAGKIFLWLADYTAVYFPNATTAVSQVQVDYFRERFGREVAHIPNGVSRVEPVAPNWILGQGLQPDRYILCAARLVKEKGLHFLIEAYRAIDTDMKLVLAGAAPHEGSYRSHLRSLAGDDSRIMFPGFVTGAPMEELFSNAYLFCLPSTLEGLPVALLDAMNFGNCCLSSNIPENLEAMGGHGYTFRNRDVDDLRRVLSDLIDNPDKVNVMKGNAMAHVRRTFSWDRVTEQMEALYRSIANTTGQSSLGE